jgi:hypothetical protein
MQALASACEAYVLRVFGFIPMDLVASGVAITGGLGSKAQHASSNAFSGIPFGTEINRIVLACRCGH